MKEVMEKSKLEIIILGSCFGAFVLIGLALSIFFREYNYPLPFLSFIRESADPLFNERVWPTVYFAVFLFNLLLGFITCFRQIQNASLHDGTLADKSRTRGAWWKTFRRLLISSIIFVVLFAIILPESTFCLALALLSILIFKPLMFVISSRWSNEIWRSTYCPLA